MISDTKKPLDYYCLFYFSLIFIYLKGREKLPSLLVYSTDGCNSRVWARSKPGARIFQVCQLGSGVQALEPLSTAFLGTLVGSWLEVEQPGHKLEPRSRCRWRPSPLHHRAGPRAPVLMMLSKHMLEVRLLSFKDLWYGCASSPEAGQLVVTCFWVSWGPL